MPSIWYEMVFACFVMSIFSTSSMRSKRLQSVCLDFVPNFSQCFVKTSVLLNRFIMEAASSEYDPLKEKLLSS